MANLPQTLELIPISNSVVLLSPPRKLPFYKFKIWRVWFSITTPLIRALLLLLLLLLLCCCCCCCCCCCSIDDASTKHKRKQREHLRARVGASLIICLYFMLTCSSSSRVFVVAAAAVTARTRRHNLFLLKVDYRAGVRLKFDIKFQDRKLSRTNCVQRYRFLCFPAAAAASVGQNIAWIECVWLTG